MGKAVCCKMNIKIFNTPEQVSNELSSYIISKYILRGKNIAISGGSTPIMLFKEISKKLTKKEKIESNFYWIDERCVLPNSKESNFKTANDYLFNKINIDKKNIYRIIGENNPDDEQKRYTELLENNLKSINKLPSIDLSILGIGNDGHTASIFPYQMKKFIDFNTCFIGTHPISKQKRISLSQNIINNSSEIIFHVTGKNKSDVVDEIINERRNYKSYPASYIKPSFGKLSWYLDFDAAKNLTK